MRILGRQSASAMRIGVPPAAIKSARLETALLETEGRNRKDTNHYALTFLEVPCLRALRAGRSAREFQRDIPFLRLLLISKAGEVVVAVISSHDAPPSNTKLSTTMNRQTEIESDTMGNSP